MTLVEAITTVRELLVAAEAAAGRYSDDPSTWHRRHKDAMQALARRVEQDFAAKVTDRWDAARVRMMGITSTSTSGIGGAIHNWIAAAEKKAGAA
jgi:hypothetical protein